MDTRNSSHLKVRWIGRVVLPGRVALNVSALNHAVEAS